MDIISFKSLHLWQVMKSTDMVRNRLTIKKVFTYFIIEPMFSHSLTTRPLQCCRGEWWKRGEEVNASTRFLDIYLMKPRLNETLFKLILYINSIKNWLFETCWLQYLYTTLTHRNLDWMKLITFKYLHLYSIETLTWWDISNLVCFIILIIISWI